MKLPQPTARGKALARELSAFVAASCDPADLWAASRDAWPRALLWTRAGLTPHPPDAVAWPSSTEEVAALVRYAARARAPLVPLGGGGGACGGAVPVRGGVTVDLRRLSAPPRLDLARRFVEVEAGVAGARLEELLNAQGATLGHRPQGLAAATVGGWLATRSAGHGSARYGKIEDLVLAVEAVDGTGAVLRTREGPSAGPNLAQLLLGSEGTLAIFTRARLRCWPLPASRWLRGVRFPSMRQGLRALQSILRAGLRPAVAQLHDPLESLLAGKPGPLRVEMPAPLRWALEAGQQETLRAALKAPLLLNRLVDALPASSLLVLGFEGDGPQAEDECAEEGDAALAACEGAGGEDLGPAAGERWLAQPDRGFRQQPLFAAGAFVDTVEVATTWDRLEALHASLRRAVRGHALALARCTHAYLEGCSLELTLVGLAGMTAAEARAAGADDRELDFDEAALRYDACWKAALSAVADAGATLSHGGGVGLQKQLFLQREHGEGMRQLRALKRAFDPHGILNPGKLLL